MQDIHNQQVVLTGEGEMSLRLLYEVNKPVSKPAFVAYREILNQWMEEEKPYKSKDFRLLDLHQVLPLNRTYLSKLINEEYGCSFYRFVMKYRIDEAKRLMNEFPEMLMQKVAEQCGFSSPTVFGRVFARETGLTPTEWNSRNENKNG